MFYDLYGDDGPDVVKEVDSVTQEICTWVFTRQLPLAMFKMASRKFSPIPQTAHLAVEDRSPRVPQKTCATRMASKYYQQSSVDGLSNTFVKRHVWSISSTICSSMM